MASAKKTKKSKGVTLSLQEFTAKIDGEIGQGTNVVYAPSSKRPPILSSWADEMEEDEGMLERIVLPSAPRASRGPAVNDADIPKTPPFQVNIGNLHYDIDEEDIYKFFRDLEVTELKLPRDHATNRIKGFGFVVFETRQDLVDALIMNEQMLRGRPIRIALLTGDGGARRQGGDSDRGQMRRDRPPAEDEGVDDWRSEAGNIVRGGPSSQQQQFRGGHDRSDRRSHHEPQEEEEDFDRGMMRSRDDFNSYNNQGRGGGGGHDRFPPRGRDRDYDDGQQGRGGDDEWRQGQRHHHQREDGEDEEFVRPQVVERPERPVRQGHDRDRDRDMNIRGRDSFEQRPSSDRGDRGDRGDRDEQQQQPTKERKKLILQPRSSKPVSESNPAGPASIFGEARPVDTLKRELEIEEKLKSSSSSADNKTEEFRLLSRDGSEKRIEINKNNLNNWRESNNRQQIHREDSEPEDDRELKVYYREGDRDRDRDRGGNQRQDHRYSAPPPRSSGHHDRDRDPRRQQQQRPTSSSQQRQPPRVILTSAAQQQAASRGGHISQQKQQIQDEEGFIVSNTSRHGHRGHDRDRDQQQGDESDEKIGVINKFSVLNVDD